MAAIFKTKLVNDELLARNGEKVEILERQRDIYLKVRFEDGTESVVFSSEVHYE